MEDPAVILILMPLPFRRQLEVVLVFDRARWVSFPHFVRYDVPLAVAIILAVEAVTCGDEIRTPICLLGAALICVGQICFLGADDPELDAKFPVIGLSYVCPFSMMYLFDAAASMQVYCRTGEMDSYLRSLSFLYFSASCFGMSWFFLRKAKRIFPRNRYQLCKSICGITFGSLAAVSGLSRGVYNTGLYCNSGARSSLLWSIAYMSVGIVGTGVAYFHLTKPL